MRSMAHVARLLRRTEILAGLLAAALTTPARADWGPVPEVPATVIFSVQVEGDTIMAGASAVIYLSTDAGETWHASTTPVAGVTSIQDTWVRNGRIYAATYGQGVHYSDDFGETWHPYNEGLVGGILDTQLNVVDLEARGDSLFAATAGAGVYVRRFTPPSTWSPFGTILEENQASNVNSLALGEDRLLLSAGANGQMFFSDRDDADWTVSNLDNVGLHPGLSAFAAQRTSTGWVVGTNRFFFRSSAGQEPWTVSDPGFGSLNWTAFASQGGHLFGAFTTSVVAIVQESDDNGASWQSQEFFPSAFVFHLAIHGDTLYAARADGLWRRSPSITSVPQGHVSHPLRFALAGPQPFADHTRLRFELPAAEEVSIQVFDVLGRAVGGQITGFWSAGPHEVDLDARRLDPGVYMAVLSAGAERAVVRLVHLR